jgi:hypothetical protein
MSLFRSDVVQLLTLWFAVLIFLQTGSGGSGGLRTAIGMFAVALVWLIPLYLLSQLTGRLLDFQAQ